MMFNLPERIEKKWETLKIYCECEWISLLFPLYFWNIMMLSVGCIVYEVFNGGGKKKLTQ